MYPYMLQRKLLVLVDGFPYSHKVATLGTYYFKVLIIFFSKWKNFSCLDESNLLGVAFYTKLLDPR